MSDRGLESAAEAPSGGQRRAPITAAARARFAADARGFLRERYCLDASQESALAAVPVVWTRGRDHQRGRYVHGAGHGVGGPHIVLNVPRGTSTRLWLYRRVSAGLTTPAGGLVLPVRLVLTVTLVHEYTHAMQYQRLGVTVPRGEVEPTRNQIRFLRDHAPEAFARLIPVERSPGRRRKSETREATVPFWVPPYVPATLIRFLVARRGARGAPPVRG